jgi:hypothetical protein
MTRKVLICILALLFFSSVAFAGTKLIQQAAIPDDTALTVAGGATPYVDGYNLDLSDMAPLSKAFLFLRNEGTSTSLSVTYKTGFVILPRLHPKAQLRLQLSILPILTEVKREIVFYLNRHSIINSGLQIMTQQPDIRRQ